MNRFRANYFHAALLALLFCAPVAQAAPVNTITFKNSYISPEGLTYISGETPVTLSAAVVGADVAGIYYAVAAPGLVMPSTETWDAYEGDFTLPEGPQVIYFAGVDVNKDYAVSSATVYVDATAPVTGLYADKSRLAKGILYVDIGEPLMLAAKDKAVNDVASGIMATLFVIDQPLADRSSSIENTQIGGQLNESPSVCYLGEPQFSTAPAGSCQNYVYNGPFTLTPGMHTVYYMSADNAYNGETLRVSSVTVQGQATISGTINTGLTGGATVMVVLSKDMFRTTERPMNTFYGTGSVPYTITLPAPATYYVGALSGEFAEHGIAPGSYLGFYDHFSPVSLAPGESRAGIDFPIVQDLEPPLSAINWPVSGTSVDTITYITGTASDNIGVESLQCGVLDLTSGLWWSPNDGTWISTSAYFSKTSPVFSGPPYSTQWRLDAADPDSGFSGKLRQGHEYAVYIRAIDFLSNLQAEVAAATFTWTGSNVNSAPGAVEGLTGAGLGVSSISWTWNAVEGADGYGVYLDGVFMSSVAAPAYISMADEPNTGQYLSVVAHNAYGPGEDGPGLTAHTLAAAPGTPWFISRTTHSVLVEWDSNGNAFGTRYELYISSDDFQTIITTRSSYGAMTLVTDLESGAYYSVRVSAINSDQFPSAYSAAVSTRTLSAPPEPPANLAYYYLSDSKSVGLFWTEASAGAVSFKVYKLDQNGYPALAGQTADYYFEDALAGSGTYYYYLTALNADGAESAASATLTAPVDAGDPSEVSDIRVSSADAGTGQARVSWTVPYDDGGLDHYVIKAADIHDTWQDWENSVFVASVPATVPMGGIQTCDITVPSTGSVRVLWMIAVDHSGNSSALNDHGLLEFEPPVITTQGAVSSGAVVGRPFTTAVNITDNYRVAYIRQLADGVQTSSTAIGRDSYNADVIWNPADLADGAHTFAIEAVDLSGNSARAELPVNVAYTAPAAPYLAYPVQGFSLRPSDSVSVGGRAEPGIYVIILVNGGLVTMAQAGADGYFNSPGIQFGSDGAKVISAVAVDSRGSTASTFTITGIVDSGAPYPPLLSAAAAAHGGTALTWEAPSGETPASYNLYRSASETDLAEGGDAAAFTPEAVGIRELEYLDYPPADGVYYYAAASVDAANNISTFSNVASVLSDRVPPTGIITLPGQSQPLGAGDHPVRLEVSEVLSAAPYITFTPVDGTPAQVVMRPSTAYVWVGTLTVTQTMNTGTGVFGFQGVDLSGNAGTELTSGAAVDVNTAGPAAAAAIGTAAWPYLKAGAHTVTLALDKAAANAPALAFNAADGTQTVALSSAASAALWTGFITITTATGDGSHALTYSARDLLGNTGTLISGATYFIADTVAPAAPAAFGISLGAGGRVDLGWSSPSARYYPANYCVYRDSALVTCAVKPDSSGAGAYSETPGTAAYSYYVTAVDQAGNEGAPAAALTVTPDITAPAAPVLTAVAEGAQVTLNWTGDASAVKYRLYLATNTITSAAGLAYTALEGGSAVNTPKRDGVYYYYLTALDGAGNESALSDAAVVSYGAAAPEITVTGIADGAYYNKAVKPAFTAYDLSLARLTAQLNGAAFISGAVVSAAGGYTLAVNGVDASGNSSTATLHFTIDKTSPAITVAGADLGGYYEAAVCPVITAADLNLATVTATLNGADFVIGSTITTSGSYILNVTATDLAGNTAYNAVAFTVDLPSSKPLNVAAVIENNAAVTLSWTAPQADVAGYKIYKDGTYITPLSAAQLTYRDTAWTAAAAHTYEITAIDSKGRAGETARAIVPPVAFSLAGYGNYSGAVQALNRGFFDSVRFTAVNNGSQSMQTGQLALMALGATYTAQGVSLAAGASAELAPVMFTNTNSADSIAGKAALALPAGGDAAISAVRTFTMAVRDAIEPVVEIFSEPLVRGGYAKVKVKINNRGSVAADIITARKSGSSVVASSSVAVSLKTTAGFLLSHGELTQSTVNVSVSLLDGAQVYFARVPAGGSFTFSPVQVAVPEDDNETNLSVACSVRDLIYSLPVSPVLSTVEFTAAQTMATALAVPYKATLSADKAVYDKSARITLAGQFQDIWGNYLEGIPLVVTVSHNGFDRALTTVSGSSGAYSVSFTPGDSEAGLYTASVRHPDIVGSAAETTFSVVGMELGYKTYTVTMARGSVYALDLEIKNTGETDLTGLSAVVESVDGSGVAITPGSMPATILAGQTYKLPVSITANAAASNVATLRVTIAESNGYIRIATATVNTVAAQIIPKVAPQLFELGILAGDIKTQVVTVANVGFSIWTGVQITSPTLDWVKVSGVQNLGDIAPGKNVSFVLSFAPPSEFYNGGYAQNPLITLTSLNYAAVAVNAAITVTSTKKGAAYFNIASADIAPGTAGSHIGSANMTLTSLDIPGMVLTAVSDTNGLARFEDIASGKYAYKVTASGYSTVSGTIEIDPGTTKTTSILLPTTMVTYKWSVTPTTITDKYDITVDMTFRTDVPAPAIVINPPVITLDMEGGQTAYTQYAITNRGLVSVFDFELTPTEDNPAIKIETPFTTIAEIKPGETVVVPVKVHLVHASCESGGINHKGKDKCAAGSLIERAYEFLRIIAGNICPSGGSSGASSDWVGPYTMDSDGVGVASLNISATTTSGCTIGSCEKDSDCAAPADICQKAVCESGICVARDNSAETNTKVSTGKLSITSCLHRKANGYTGIPNGCGTTDNPIPPPHVTCDSGVEIDFTPDCNEHDVLYATCNTDKDFADRRLQILGLARCNKEAANDLECYSKCVNRVNNGYKLIVYSGYLPFQTVYIPKIGDITFSDKAYGDAQRNACTCCPK